MVAPSRISAGRMRVPSYLLPSLFTLIALTLFFLYQVDDFASRTKTLAGHNLEPTPWHIFPRKSFDVETRQARTYKIIQCSYLACSFNDGGDVKSKSLDSSSLKPSKECPDFFRFIHHDLEPWSRTGITEDHIMGAKKYAAFRVVILDGRLYLDLYYACVQSRMLVTVWGLLQLLARYPGMVPDVDMMFDCMDKPILNRAEHEHLPLPLFRYCTTKNHFDIPFPDWSFWGWSETNIRPWDVEFQDIKQGSKARSWQRKWPRAFWRGNPDVAAPIRQELLRCNHSRRWGAQILRQDWGQEAMGGYANSKLSRQCDYRYKIYAEGYAWSVSLKYIVSCGSLAFIISPQYEDFFSRGLFPKKNYWPVSAENMCESIKFAVDWGNANSNEAQAMGQAGQNLMETLSMDRVYDYMLHLITEYSKLQRFKPVPSPSSQKVCPDSVLCLAEEKERELLKSSSVLPSPNLPCTLQPADSGVIKSWLEQKQNLINEVREMERMKT